MGGQIGSQLGSPGLLGAFCVVIWLLFGPIMFLRLLLQPEAQRFRERTRNMWLSAGMTVAPLLFSLLGRLLDRLG